MKMKSVEKFYDVKCNEYGNVMEVMDEIGKGFECEYKVEIKKIIEIGVENSSIILENNDKKEYNISKEDEIGVEKMKFEKENEMKKIKRL